MSGVQTSYSLNQVAGFAGQLADNVGHDIISALNNSTQVESFALTLSSSISTGAYTVKINTTSFVYTAATSTSSTANIVAGLVALINAGSIAVTASGTDTPLLVTGNAPGFSFTASSSAVNGTLVDTQTQAAGEVIPYGVAVVRDSANNDQGIKTPKSSTDVSNVIGISLATQGIESGQATTSTAQYPAGSTLPVLKRGRCYVVVEEAVTPESPVFIRYASGAGGTQPGSFRTSADTSTAAANTKFKFMSTAAAGAIAVVDILN